MVKSLFNPAIDLQKDHYVATFISTETKRKNGRKGVTGFVILEGLSEENHPFIRAVGKKFGKEKSIECYTLPIYPQNTTQESFLASIGHEKSVKLWFHVTDTGTGTFKIYSKPNSKAGLINRSEAENLFKKNIYKEIDSKTFSEAEYSLQRSLRALFKPGSIIKLRSKEKYDFHLNPFGYLSESKKFVFARIIRRSSFLKRLKDTFIVFNGGNDGEYYDVRNNDVRTAQWGLLDYFFPFAKLSHLLRNAILNFRDRNPNSRPIRFFSMALVALVLPIYSILTITKFVASALLTFACLPFIAPIHFSLLYHSKKLKNNVNGLEIQKINSGEFEDIADLNATSDLKPTSALKNDYIKTNSSTSKKIDSSNLIIKPIQKSEDHFSIIKKGTTPDKIEYLGLFYPKSTEEPKKTGAPFAVIEVNDTNRGSIKAMMKLNMFRINNALEKVGAIETVAKTVGLKV